MDKNRKNIEYSGQITVFLTLILLIMITFLTTAIQSARLSALQSYSERNVKLGLQGLFSQYARPMWDNYHLFMLESEDENYYTQEIEAYQGDISGSLFQKEGQTITIEDMTCFLDDNGAYFRKQMVDYMKYHIPETIVSSEANDIEERNKNSQTASLLDDQIELTQSQSAMDQSVQDIIWLIEGVKIENGYIKTANNFVKQLCNGEITPQQTGVHNEIIWEKIKSEYICYDQIPVQHCTRLIGVISQALNKIEKLESEAMTAASSIKVSKAKHASMDTSKLNSTGLQVLEEIQSFEQTYEEKGQESYQSIIRMKEQLQENQAILSEYLSKVYTEDAEEVREILKGYKTRNLVFDYSDFVLEEPVNPAESVKNSFSNGLLSLVLDEVSTISTKLYPDDLFFQNQEKDEESQEESQEVSSDKSCDTTMVEDISKAAKESQVNAASKTVVEVKNQILEIEYYLKHFSCYTERYSIDSEIDDSELSANAASDEKSVEHERPYRYELEFIAAGGETEKEALTNVLNRLLLQRSLSNFSYLFTRKDICEKAHLTAVALVGFSGMEALIQMTKFTILYMYAMAEAVIDIALMLEGKEVAVWKTEQTFLLSYEELYQFNRGLVKQKVENAVPLTGGITQSYKDFLKELLYLRAQERRLNNAASLIQKNLKELYYEDFSITNGVCSMNVSGIYAYKEMKEIHVNVNCGY